MVNGCDSKKCGVLESGFCPIHQTRRTYSLEFLKQEAIKWVKENESEWITSLQFKKDGELSDNEITKNAWLQNWLKFFDIKIEDLK